MLSALLALSCLVQDSGDGRPPLLLDLLERDLASWVAMPPAPGAWDMAGDTLQVRGEPEGCLRSRAAWQEFRLAFAWRRPEGGPAPGILVGAGALPEAGGPWPRGQRLPLPEPGDAAWHQVEAEGRAGRLRIRLDGGPPRDLPVEDLRGHLAILADGHPLEIRDLRLEGKPAEGEEGSPLAPEEDWQALYNGADLSGWRRAAENAAHWQPAGRILRGDGLGEHLWTMATFQDLELVLDWRWPAPPVQREVPVVLPDGTFARDARGQRRLVEVADAGDSGLFLRGSEKAQVNLWCWPLGSGGIYGYRTDADLPEEIRKAATPARAADRPPGEWNRLRVFLRGERIRVWVNGIQVLEEAHLPGLPPQGPLGLQAHGSPVEFTNLYVRRLPSLPTTRPEPNDHRPGRLETLADRARIHQDTPLVFVGDGVVEQFATRGRTVWARFFGGRGGLNLGLDWERTENLLWRLQAGHLDGLRPRLLILEIGGENLRIGHTPRQVAAGVQLILEELRGRLPRETRVLLLGILPRGTTPADPLRPAIREANALLAGLADGERIHFVDPGWALVEADGSLSPEVSWDGHHLTVLGYRLLAVALEPAIRRLLGEAGG